MDLDCIGDDMGKNKTNTLKLTNTCHSFNSILYQENCASQNEEFYTHIIEKF